MAKKPKIVEVKVEADKPKGMLEKLNIVDGPDLAKQVMNDFNNAEQTKWLWIPERNEDVKNYFGVIQNSEWPFKGASQIKSQFFRIIVDTLAGNLVKSLFGPEKPIRALPAPLNKDSSDLTLQNIKYVEDLHNSLQENEYNLKQVLDKAVPTSLIESFVVLHPAYEYLTRNCILTVKRWVAKDLKAEDLTYDLETDTVSQKKDNSFVYSLDAESGYESDDLDTSKMQEVIFDVDQEECVKDGISIKTINGYRFYMPLGTPGETPDEKVQRAPYLVHQLFYTLKEVKAYAEQGYFEDVNIVENYMFSQLKNKNKNNPNGKPVLASTTYDRQRELITYTKLQQAGFLLDTARLEYEYVEILKWCGKWKIEGKTRDLIVWMDRNTGAVLRVEANIFGIKPYFILCPFPIDETPYGESLCKIVRPLVKEIDLLMRTITNIALMKSAPPKFYDPASGFNPQAIGQFGPNSWIPAREPARNILIPQQPEDPQIAFQMLNFIINIIERITGINEVVQGEISKRANTTATEVNQALIRSGVRFDSVYERLKDQLKPMIKYIHKLTLRYMPTTKEARMMGKSNDGRLIKIHKAQLQGAYEFELTGTSIVTEQQELQNAITLFNTLGNHPYLSYKPESIYYVLFNIVKRLNPIAMDLILPTPDEVKVLERQKSKVQGQQEQMAVQQQQQQMLSQGQQQQMSQQMEVGNQRQRMTLEAQAAQQDAQQKQMEFEQKMRHGEESHRMKMRHMEETKNLKIEEANAKTKEKPKESK